MCIPPAIPLVILLVFSFSAFASEPEAPPDPAPAATGETTATRAPIAVPLPPDSAMLRTTRNAILGLNSGHLLSIAAMWTIPGLYDVGMLTMMGSKKVLKIEYVKRYHEDPTEFEQAGDDAYWQGWAMKGGAVASLVVLANLAKEPGLGVIGFVILWMGGTFKHYEASRMLYEQSRHYENGILDENPPMPGLVKAGDGERFTLRYSAEF